MSLHVHLSPLGGIAGDMFVAACLDALPEMTGRVLQAVRAVLPEGAGASLQPVVKNGISARTFAVTAPGSTAPVSYTDMVALLENAKVGQDVKRRAISLLTALGEAEAAVHQVPLDRVHFHEIADWDTLADLTAAACLIEAEVITGWSLDPLPLGGGTVATRHGILAVPAPATARLIRGLPVHDDAIAGERITPTGAAIARALPRIARPGAILQATGYGAGVREFPGIANVLVAQVLETGQCLPRDTVLVMSFDIDDMTGEEIATSCDRLRETQGVLDVATTALTGKKGRAMTGFRLLVAPAHEAEAAQACFRQTSTLGLRVRREDRRVLTRETGDVEGLRIKTARRPGGDTVKVEADDLVEGDTLSARRTMARQGEAGQ